MRLNGKRTASTVNPYALFTQRTDNMYTTVIFDLDGTLLDTLSDLHASVNFALRELSFPERTREEIRRFIGNGVVKLIERSVPTGTDKEKEKKCFDAFRQHYLEHMADNTVPFSGITELLLRLKQKGIKTAVVSNKLHSAVVGLCDDFFPGLIDCALGVSDESERKPAPTNVYKAFELLGCNNKSTVYVGDSEVDVQTAKNAGLECIGVTWGFRDKEELLTAGSAFIADNTDGLFRIIVGDT